MILLLCNSKSALINRLLGRRRARTANIPGVTRSLQWIRVRTDDTKKANKKEYELLDSPGIIPASLDDQSDALLLAACHCIGEASYDNQVRQCYVEIVWGPIFHLFLPSLILTLSGGSIVFMSMDAKSSHYWKS